MPNYPFVSTTRNAIVSLFAQPGAQVGVTVLAQKLIDNENNREPNAAQAWTKTLTNRITEVNGLVLSCYSFYQLMAELFDNRRWFHLTNAQRAVVAVMGLGAVGCEIAALAAWDKPDINLQTGLLSASSMFLSQLARVTATASNIQNDGTVNRDDVAGERTPFVRP